MSLTHAFTSVFACIQVATALHCSKTLFGLGLSFDTADDVKTDLDDKMWRGRQQWVSSCMIVVGPCHVGCDMYVPVAIYMW